MIIGDPYLFALEFQKIENWTSLGDAWINGIFVLYIDGNRLPPRVDTAELRTSLGTYLGIKFSEFNSSTTHLSNAELFKLIKRYVCQEDEQADDDIKNIKLLDLTCTVMEDQGCYVFLVRKSEHECLIWTTDFFETLDYKFLPFGTVERVITILPSPRELFVVPKVE